MGDGGARFMSLYSQNLERSMPCRLLPRRASSLCAGLEQIVLRLVQAGCSAVALRSVSSDVHEMVHVCEQAASVLGYSASPQRGIFRGSALFPR